MLSNTCKYGIRALSYLASKSEESKNIRIKQISDDLKLPTPFLAKIFQQFVKNKILISSKGPHGGYSFIKDPSSVSLYDIIEIIDGCNFFETCIIHNRKCESEGNLCPIHEDYEKIRKSIIKLFQNTSIYQLVIAESKSKKIIL